MAKIGTVVLGITLATVGTLAGCGVSEEQAQTPAARVAKCYEANESPLRVTEVREAFSANGIELFSDPGKCGGEGAIAFGKPVAGLTNVVFSGPFANIADHAEVARREGHVICSVSAVDSGRRKVVAYQTEKGGAGMLVANVDCVIYADGDAARAQEAAMRRAVRALAARVRHVERPRGA